MPLHDSLPAFFEIAPESRDGTFYNLGFPVPTGKSDFNPDGDFSDFPRPSGLNGSQWFTRYSRGVAISSRELDSISELNEGDFELESIKNEKNIFFTTADGMRGYSGGPILDSQGRVVALYSSGSSNVLKNGKGFRSFTIGVRPPDWD